MAVLFELGIVGLGLLGALMVQVLRNVRKCRRDIQVVLWAGIFATAVASMFIWTIQYLPFWLTFYAIPIVFGIGDEDGSIQARQ